MTGTEKKKVARVVDAVQRSLTPDLLRPKYRGDPNPVAGHCAVATEAVYFLLGGKESGLTPTQMSIEGDTHWFLRAKDGSIIDPTASQFSCPVPYEQGRGRGFPTPKRGLAVQPPSARAQKVMDRARRLLGENLAGLPKRGRVPLATAQRALKSLGRKAKACGITASALRDGMEVEREHRDVTKGGALKTARIAAAHLCESPRYYRELRKMEKRLKRGK